MPDPLTPELTTGIVELDAEHREVLALIRALVPALKQGSESLRPLLDRIAQHLDAHFHHEEGVLAAAGYPQLSAHQAEHQRLRDYFARLRADLEEHGEGVLEVSCRLLAGAIATHIQEHDRQFVAHLAAVA